MKKKIPIILLIAFLIAFPLFNRFDIGVRNERVYTYYSWYLSDDVGHVFQFRARESITITTTGIVGWVSGYFGNEEITIFGRVAFIRIVGPFSEKCEETGETITIPEILTSYIYIEDRRNGITVFYEQVEEIDAEGNPFYVIETTIFTAFRDFLIPYQPPIFEGNITVDVAYRLPTSERDNILSRTGLYVSSFFNDLLDIQYFVLQSGRFYPSNRQGQTTDLFLDYSFRHNILTLHNPVGLDFEFLFFPRTLYDPITGEYIGTFGTLARLYFRRSN
jgi:hypothetical protein